MKLNAMLVGLTGKGTNQMVEGFHFDFDFPCDEFSIINKQLSNDVINCQLFIILKDEEYYLDLEKIGNNFKIIKNEKEKIFLVNFLNNNLEEKFSIKKHKI